MKKLFSLLVALCCLAPVALAEPAAETVEVSLSGAGYCVAVPAGWTVETDDDWHRAVLVATSPDGARQIAAFCSRFDRWGFDEYAATLRAASEKNGSVRHIAETTLGERRFATYDRALTEADAQAWCAVAELDAHVFLTLEFRALAGDDPLAAFGALPEQVALSLRAE